MRETGRGARALPATTEERLEELGRRIGVLEARTQYGIERRLAALREGEASARAAVDDGAASVEGRLLHLDTKVTLAEQAAGADMADDAATFATAIAEELRSWDVYLERLQVKAATRAGSGRQQAEDAISELRRYRTALGARVRELISSSGEGWRESREHVQAIRDELESRGAEVEAALR